MSDIRPTRTMSTRAFLKGGYKEPGDDPIVVLSGDAVAFVVYPGTTALLVREPETEHLTPARSSGPVAPSLGFRPAPKPSAARKRGTKP